MGVCLIALHDLHAQHHPSTAYVPCFLITLHGPRFKCEATWSGIIERSRCV